MKDIEAELLSHELGMSFLRPITRVTWKQRVMDTIILLGILAGVIALSVAFFALGGAALAAVGVNI